MKTDPRKGLTSTSRTAAASTRMLERKHMEQVISLLQNMSAYNPPRELHDAIWTRFESQPNVFSVVAIENELVVGYGSITIEGKIRGGKMGHVEDIVTHPRWTKKGIGRIVVNALREIARANGCYKISLQCQKHNIVFYEKCGFRASGTAMQLFLGD